MTEEYLEVKPSDFVFPPYKTCPECNRESFGVLNVGNRNISRRCEECLYEDEFPLPEIRKNILYLDQFVISNLAILEEKPERLKQDGTFEFWKRLNKKVRELIQKQILVCPSSSFHLDESILDDRFEKFREIYNYLADGISFRNPEEIRSFQLCEFFKKWLKNKDVDLIEVESINPFHQNPHTWSNPYIISAKFPITEEMIKEVEDLKVSHAQGLKEVFKRWQTETNKSFRDWFEGEVLDYGPTIFSIFDEYRKLTSREKIATSTPQCVMTIHKLLKVYSDLNGNDGKALKTVREFLHSDVLKSIPFNRINGMLYASYAHRAAHGNLNTPPDGGDAYDIEMASILIPYCDGMFVDKSMHSLLTEQKELRNYINSKETRLFSKNNSEDFFDWLDELKSTAPSEKKEAVVNTYGFKW
jgi:hypothetical protein